MIDVTQFVGQVHEVTEPDTGRTVTIAIGDGGPCPWWDHRGMITLTVSFADGKRSHVDTASGAAGQLAEKLFAPFSVAALGDDGWGLLTGREYRKGGPKNGRTSFTFTVFPGPLDQSARIEEITRELPLEDQLKAIEQHYRERAGIAEVEARYAASQAQYARR
jgi:hypothetical protein